MCIRDSNDGNTGTQGSGGDLEATGTTTVNITAVNDAPMINNFDSSLNYTFGADPVTIDDDVTIFDAELSAIDNFDGSTLFVGWHSIDGHRITVNGTPVSLNDPIVLFDPIAGQNVTIGTVGTNSLGELPFHLSLIHI